MFALVLTGPPGAGKTSVLEALSDALSAEDIRHAMVELEALTSAHPPLSDDRWLMPVQAVCELYNRFGYGLLLAAVTAESDEHLREVLGAIGADEHVVVRLEAQPATLRRRIIEREPAAFPELDELVAAATRLTPVIAGLDGVALAVSTEGQRPEAVAARIRAAWPTKLRSGGRRGIPLAVESALSRRDTAPMSMGNAELVRKGFDAFLDGDFETLSNVLDPTVQWLGPEPSNGDCYDREKVLATLRDAQQDGVVSALNAVAEGGEQVFAELTGPRREEYGLPDGQACMVVTVRNGRIVRMQDHRSRAEALAGAGLAPKPAPEPPTPLAHTEPGWDQVSDLVPFAHADDIDASVRFYERLGFHVRESYRSGERLNWAFLQAGHARLMLARADAPIIAREQATFFYLYARDLFALRERLVQADVDAGEIRDGTPGPKLEMRVEDPDGYVLMIAQIDDEQVIVDG